MSNYREYLVTEKMDLFEKEASILREELDKERGLRELVDTHYEILVELNWELVQRYDKLEKKYDKLEREYEKMYNENKGG